jgi:selenide,water dikinase
VNGIVDIKNLKKNSTAVASCRLYLTKALGVGILSTAQKRGILKTEHAALALQSMCKLNKQGEALGRMPEVKAMTDVTGFGLLGHLAEMCEGSNLQAVIEFDKVPKMDGINEYLDMGCIPGGTNRNWASYSHKISPLTDRQKNILADPQTSGGLLIAVATGDLGAFELVLKNSGVDEQNIVPIGWLEEKTGNAVIKVS